MDTHLIRTAEIKFNLKIVRIVQEIPILHSGWEMDNKGWLVELEGGKLQALTTNHGSLCLWTQKDLQAKYEETKASAKALLELVHTLQEHVPTKPTSRRKT